MKLALLQLDPTVGDFPANTRKLLDAYRRACSQGAELVVAPELFLCGYPPRDLLLRPDFVERNLQALAAVAKEVGTVPLCVGYVDRNPARPGKPLLNAAAFIEGGQVRHRVVKTLLPTYDVFDEDRYFEPAHAAVPIEFKGRKLALTICEDIWNDEDFWPQRLYRRDPVKELIAAGAELVVNLSASPWHRGKEKTRLEMLRKVARDEGVVIVQANAVGGNDELIFDGHSVAIDARGEVLTLAPGFREEIVVVDLDTQKSAPVEWPQDEELLFDALCLGVRDYVGKCGFKSVALGLSGGIDSALVATIAAHALGPDKVLGVALPSKFSSDHSLRDAEQLARNLGIRYEVIEIEPAVAAVNGQLAGIFSQQKADVTEENVQSRLRGLILMAISNKFGSLVLTTGNKSEMAVGYCTLYGDMCGALAVIADVFKTEVYALSRWINREREIIPASSITKAPSAELRPNQTDQDSLPPYDVLDAILRHYIVEEAGAEELVKKGFDPAVVRDVINKVTFSEYKRRQAAPGLKVSPRAFGVGRRIPVAQRFKSQTA
jgi:NAD+ synthase (glutamine-hydrolysing)